MAIFRRLWRRAVQEHAGELAALIVMQVREELRDVVGDVQRIRNQASADAARAAGSANRAVGITPATPAPGPLETGSGDLEPHPDLPHPAPAPSPAGQTHPKAHLYRK